MKQPTIFLSHGGGPCFSIDVPGDPFGPLRRYLEALITSLPELPKTVLLVSAHWLEPVTTVSTAARPSMIYDYYGFPDHTYRIVHPAAGDPETARTAAQMLRDASINVAEDPSRGFDHGVFVPMMVVDPAASIPIVSLSLRSDLDPATHLAVGAALSPLRDEGVLILGSGNSFHNLRSFMDGADGHSSAFDEWLTDAVLNSESRDEALSSWDQVPHARDAHPEPDHLLPLMVVAGAARGEAARVDFHDVLMGKAISGYRFG